MTRPGERAGRSRIRELRMMALLKISTPCIMPVSRKARAKAKEEREKESPAEAKQEEKEQRQTDRNQEKEHFKDIAPTATNGPQKTRVPDAR